MFPGGCWPASLCGTTEMWAAHIFSTLGSEVQGTRLSYLSVISSCITRVMSWASCLDLYGPLYIPEKRTAYCHVCARPGPHPCTRNVWKPLASGSALPTAESARPGSGLGAPPTPMWPDHFWCPKSTVCHNPKGNKNDSQHHTEYSTITPQPTGLSYWTPK